VRPIVTGLRLLGDIVDLLRDALLHGAVFQCGRGIDRQWMCLRVLDESRGCTIVRDKTEFIPLLYQQSREWRIA